jgi:hypothetical protein
MGEMADMMYDDALIEDEHDDIVECKFCKCSPLWWNETDNGYRLFDENNKIHSCKEYEIEAHERFLDRIGGEAMDPNA